MKVLVSRRDSFGDVLCITPVIRKLRRQLGPDAVINVHTFYPQVFLENPDVNLVSNGTDIHFIHGQKLIFKGPAKPGSELDLNGEYDRVIDLNLAFEKRYRRVHAVDAYMEEAFGEYGDDKDKDVILANAPCPFDLSYVHDAIVMHAARSEECRTLPVGFWEELVKVIHTKGRKVILVGTKQDPEIAGADIDTRHKLRPQEQAALIRQAACLVASESGILGGILPATHTPAVGLLNISLPHLTGPYRNGKLNWRFTPIMANVNCVGCAARYKEIITAHGCLENRNYECLRTFDPIHVASEIERTIRESA